MNFIKKVAGVATSSKKNQESWRDKVGAKPQIEGEENNPMSMFVMSSDTLLGREMNQKLPDGWNYKPPLFTTLKDPYSPKTLKAMCREGVPNALRCAVYVTSVVRNSRPYQSNEERDGFGTLSRVQVFDHGWEYVLKSLFSDKSDENAATMPLSKEMEGALIHDHIMVDESITERGIKGVKALTLVLYTSKENLGIEYCPMLPDVAALLLSVMSESYAYATIREMKNCGNYYFPLSKVEHYSWCKSFTDILAKMYTKTAIAMSNCGVLTPDGLDPIFRRFFVTILPRDDVMKILDIYMIEGYKVIFRIGTALLCLAHAFMTPQELDHPDRFWEGVRRVSHTDQFRFDILVKQTYGFNGKRYRSRRTFPRRRFIEKLMSYNEEWAQKSASTYFVDHIDKPLGYVDNDIPIVLAKDFSDRKSLADFLPLAYKNTKLDLIYSSNVHGRSLDLFYKHCARARHTITLVEVLNNGAIIGMFASHTWHKSKNVYGDGECVLFRLRPNPVCFHWTHNITKSMRDLGQPSDENEDTSASQIQSEAALEQYQIGRANFIAMGSNEDGLSGLSLNEDLSRGSSSKARGFNNEPLAGQDTVEFDVGLVEVYQLVREIDGIPIDGEEDIWKGMFD